MQPHGNLTASYLWQPGELARRMLGERPSPVPPTRELWPPPQQPINISTLHIAYQEEEYCRRASTLPPQPHAPPTLPFESFEHEPLKRKRVCTIGTNTDPPLSVLNRVRGLFKRREYTQPPPGRLTAVTEKDDSKETENPARRALSGIKRAISGAKSRITPNQESVGSPKIVYDMAKPGDRMITTFGTRDTRKWCKLPTRASISKGVQNVGDWCKYRPRRPQRRQWQSPKLQITQV